MSSEVERVQGAVEQATRLWLDSSFLPAQFRGKDGRPLEGDVRIACARLDALSLDPRATLGDCYVVKGRLGLMADLQRALAARDGIDLELVEANPHLATVAIHRPGGSRHLVTVTMAEAERAGWTKRSPNNPNQPSTYELMPERMLAARASTKAISLYAPGVLRGMMAAGITLEVEPTPSAGGGTAPDGATIPEPLREPAIDPDVRHGLLAMLDGLSETDPDAVTAVREAWKALGCPNVRRGWLTRAHGELLKRLIMERMPERVPDKVHDDAPEASESEPGTETLWPGRPIVTPNADSGGHLPCG